MALPSTRAATSMWARCPGPLGRKSTPASRTRRICAHCRSSKRSSDLTPVTASEDGGQSHWTKTPNVDPDVELPRLRLQPSVAMAVQVDPALVHAAPRPKRIMAEHQ